MLKRNNFSGNRHKTQKDQEKQQIFVNQKNIKVCEFTDIHYCQQVWGRHPTAPLVLFMCNSMHAQVAKKKYIVWYLINAACLHIIS